jgi:endonuclease YncB( thermonuclease family)
LAFFVVFGVVAFGAHSQSAGRAFSCAVVRVTDGDTVRCGETRIRLYGIDAPELPGHCRTGRSCTPGDPYASTDNLAALLRLGEVECRAVDFDRYGRTVARCSAGGVDLSCSQLAGRFAVRRYGPISCR